jgi:Ca2+-binding RTX toxin-like protein
MLARTRQQLVAALPRRSSKTVWSRLSRRLTCEPLEAKRVFATDLSLTAFTGNGFDLVVTYDVGNEPVAAFDVNIYRSNDGTTLGDLLATFEVTDSYSRSVGSGRSVMISPNFSDIGSDYKLVAVLDANQEIGESNESNNKGAFSGGVFKTADGTVHIHGTAAADSISIGQSSNVDVAFNGANFAYAPSGVTAVRVRSHAGNDSIVSSIAADKAFAAFGGDGNDTITGGTGNDVIYAGYGDDLLNGGAGNDTLHGESGSDVSNGQAGNDALYSGMNTASYGGYGDELNGGDGNDALYGDGGTDLLRGDAGDDTITCGAGNDVAYGGAGNDFLIGGYGDDLLYGDDGDDTLFGDAGNDTLFGGDGSDAGYGSYGSYGGYGDDIDGGIGIDRIVAELTSQVADMPRFEWCDSNVDGEEARVIHGDLFDDGVMSGRYVTISGALSGSASVASDGTFYWVTMSTNVGTVFVTFYDDEGLSVTTRLELS